MENIGKHKSRSASVAELWVRIRRSEEMLLVYAKPVLHERG
jgi:hypothetical protein